MASVWSENYPKEKIIFDEVIRKYHPKYKNMCFTEELKVNDQVNSNHLNMEFLLEETIELVGNLGSSNAYGEDYLDNSECKSATTRQRKLAFNKEHQKYYTRYNTYQVSVKNLNRKKDLIRLVVYNKPYQRVDFFLFSLTEIGFKEKKRKFFTLSYNSKKDSYGKYNIYRKETFEELCQKR